MSPPIDRGAVADALDEIALLLELLGESPFKTRAYANAARVLRGLEEDLDALVRSRRLAGIRGIGPALEEKITTLVATGSLPYLQELRARVPPGILGWLAIPGLGPKKARAIHTALGITTLDDLEEAARDERLRRLDGFGAATEKKIRDGIARARERSGRFLQSIVRTEGERLLAVLRRVPGVVGVEIAGSVRRCVETSRDIDLVAAAPDGKALLDAFVSAPGVAEVTVRGSTSASVRLISGPAAELCVVSDDAFPFALVDLTGSTTHNAALRERARRLGLELGAEALRRTSGGERVLAADETAVYAALGLPWIPPELREDRGEIEAAERGALPALIGERDLQGALHCHSSWSDGTATIARMAEAARAKGWSYLAVCDHSRSAAYARGLSVEQVLEQHAEIDALNRGFDGAFTILKGTEVDILPDGALDYPDSLLARFDVVIASVHSRFGLSQADQTDRILRAVRHPLVDVLGHPTGRLLLAREPYPLDLDAVLSAAAERGVAVEINAHPSRLDLDTDGLRFGIDRGMKTCICPDAHALEGLGDVTYGVGIARRGWCTRDDVLNAWPLDRLRDHLAARRRQARR